MLAEPDVLVLPGVYDALSASLAAAQRLPRRLHDRRRRVDVADRAPRPRLHHAHRDGRPGRAHHGRPRRAARRRRRHRLRQPVERATDGRRVPTGRRRRAAHRGPGVPEALRAPRRQDGDRRRASSSRRCGRPSRRAPIPTSCSSPAPTRGRRSGSPRPSDRANRYAAAGADLIFVEAPQSLDEIARIPQEVAAPVMYNWVTGGHSPAVTLEQLQEWGYAMAIIPGLLIGTVVRAMIQALARAGAPTPDVRRPAQPGRPVRHGGPQRLARRRRPLRRLTAGRPPRRPRRSDARTRRHRRPDRRSAPRRAAPRTLAGARQHRAGQGQDIRRDGCRRAQRRSRLARRRRAVPEVRDLAHRRGEGRPAARRRLVGDR